MQSEAICRCLTKFWKLIRIMTYRDRGATSHDATRISRKPNYIRILIIYPQIQKSYRQKVRARGWKRSARGQTPYLGFLTKLAYQDVRYLSWHPHIQTNKQIWIMIKFFTDESCAVTISNHQHLLPHRRQHHFLSEPFYYCTIAEQSSNVILRKTWLWHNKMSVSQMLSSPSTLTCLCIYISLHKLTYIRAVTDNIGLNIPIITYSANDYLNVEAVCALSWLQDTSVFLWNSDTQFLVGHAGCPGTCIYVHILSAQT